jgi:UDP-N-acetylglucosamine diphosphorylase / glucose-1-phosphate thymidylyltransferase / UDP-N-acetylgalactosamine diphosphorylase / glucosamine-1-phosphate N-acetyltransferase / galactosamine-1-phosphate N-acetyltransferase
MNILLDDLSFNQSLYPFGAVRSMVHIRLGILTILEKWQLVLPGKVFLTSEYPSNDVGPVNKIPANVIPSADFFKKIGSSQDEFVFDNSCKVLEFPWQIFEYNDWAIRQDFQLLTEGKTSQKISSSNQLINPEQIFVGPRVRMEHAILNATDGPIYIGKNAEIQEGTLIRGPFALGEGSRVKMGTKIYGATTIGPYCLAGGEIKNSILMSFSNKGHDGYLGDSVIGSWCNLGAGTSNSNLKNTAGTIKIWNKEKAQFIKAGTKCGLLMGDYSRCAINTAFNTGSVVGISCNIFGNPFPPKFIEDFTWGNEKYIFEKVITDIDNWKKLKGHQITQQEIEALKNIYQPKQKQ